MAKAAMTGEMRTRIKVFSITTTKDAEGYDIETLTNVFGAGSYVKCKWVNSHGNDVYENQRLELGQVATITMRYTSLITPTCIIWHETEAGTVAFPRLNSWDVISLNNVEDRRQFLEIVVKRKVVA